MNLRPGMRGSLTQHMKTCGVRLTAMAVVVAGLSGCGGGGDEKTATSGGGSTAAKTAKAPAKKTEPKTADNSKKSAEKSDAPAVGFGTLSGTIALDGQAPDAVQVLIAKGDTGAKDSEVCAANDILDESLELGDGQGIANVFVFLADAPKGIDLPDAQSLEPVVMDQKGCVFEPHASILQAQQTLLVKSSDPVQHNVHTFPKRNSQTNLLCPPNEQDGLKVVYNKAEREPVRVQCDIHPWMKAWHLPLDHPYAAVTDANGKFEIPNVPAGKHELQIWHERGGFLERGMNVTVTADETTNVEQKYALDKFPVSLNRPVKTIVIATGR